MVLRHEKLHVDHVTQKLGDVERSIASDRTRATVIFVPFLALGVAGCFAVPPVGIIVGAVAWLIYNAKMGKLKRAREKVAFARELHDRLQDELHPRRSVILDFDLRHYDEKSKLVWSGRSIAGNEKLKYSDKWLHYRAVLADGTKLEIVRQAGVKTKKGSVVKEKRRLLLELVPNPRRYALSLLQQERPARRLRARLEAATGAFHNDPEEFHARVQGSGDALRVKVTQEDAPILANEVVTIVEEVVRFLQELRGPAAGSKITLKKPELDARERA